MAKTLDKKIQCAKCGFRPTYQKEWKLEYKDKCANYSYSNSCDWDDEVDEHLHQECPDCGYTLAVACEDHASATPDKWTTSAVTKPAVTTAIAPVTTVTKPTTLAPLSTRTTAAYTPPKPAKCGKCPVDAKASTEV